LQSKNETILRIVSNDERDEATQSFLSPPAKLLLSSFVMTADISVLGFVPLTLFVAF
jgi:hypothetical protein